jgi:hypothetical protein
MMAWALARIELFHQLFDQAAKPFAFFLLCQSLSRLMLCFSNGVILAAILFSNLCVDAEWSMDE